LRFLFFQARFEQRSCACAPHPPGPSQYGLEDTHQHLTPFQFPRAFALLFIERDLIL
jgi:hypothetical protein